MSGGARRREQVGDMSGDYFDRVEVRLLEAVERHAGQQTRQAGSPDGRLRAAGRRLRRRRTGLLLLAGALLISGTAAGAMLLSEQRSKPLTGIVPPYYVKRDTMSVAGSRYEITISPKLWAGSIGWCNLIVFRGGPLRSYGSGSCGNTTPAIGFPLFALDGEQGAGLKYVLTAPQVAAVRVPGGRTILTRHEAPLPYGFRAAVFELSKKHAVKGPLQATPLDSHGRRIPDSFDDEGIPQEETRHWASPHPPAKGACSIHPKRGSGMHIDSGHVVTRLVGDPGIIGHAFLSCEDVTFSLHGEQVGVALLLDAKRPGIRPAMLPDVRKVQGRPDLYTSLTGHKRLPEGIVARRLSNAWLVAARPRSISDGAKALSALRLGPIDLHTANGPLRPSRSAECRVSLHPGEAFTEVSQTPSLFDQGSGQHVKTNGPTRFLLCAQASFYFHRWALYARVLYRVGKRGRPSRLAGMQPLPRYRGQFTFTSPSGARRHAVEHIGRAWIEISGGRGVGQQRALLRQLTVRVGPALALRRTLPASLLKQGLLP